MYNVQAMYMINNNVEGRYNFKILTFWEKYVGDHDNYTNVVSVSFFFYLRKSIFVILLLFNFIKNDLLQDKQYFVYTI